MALALAISALVHLNLLAGLNQVFFAQAPQLIEDFIEDERSGENRVGTLDSDGDGLSGGGMGDAAPVLTSPSGASLRGLALAEEFEAGESDGEGEPFLNEAAGQGKGQGTGVGDGQGSGRGKGKGFGGGKVGFFGTEGLGTRFVFVVDCSRSMYGDRIARARNELSKTLEFLSEDQEFSIIFFSDKAIPMYEPRPAAGLVKAERANRVRARKWMVGRGAFGQTVPDEALRMALRLNPDVVYFLTDGEFDPSARDMCRRENTNHVTIHTIAFCTRKGEPLLKEIAADNGGRYRFVP